MTLENSKSVINLKLIRRSSIILFLGYLILAYAARLIHFPLLGMDDMAWTIILLLIFLIIIFVPSLLNHQYIYYSDEGENIVFRYYTTGLIPGNKNSVEINKRTFSGFTTEKKFFGLIQILTLYQRIREGVAKYPPIFLGGLNAAQKAAIIKSLSSFAPIIKGKNGDMS
ncbi:MAG: hypothetical protein RBT38_05165 [Bacteroidales bacterium]|jgi:hypothetical protein|nr:hypothetical protein [Bacteroidales bacterium]